MALIRTARDLRVDACRGLALWWIFTDHMPGNAVSVLSMRNYALCDATEIFVLLAGYGAGLAYGGTMNRHGVLFAAADVARRAWTLYVAHIFLFVVFSAQVTYSATTLDRGGYLDEIHLDVLADNPYRALLEALLLRFQPAYLNILPLYVVLLLMFIPALPLLRRPALLAALSFALYAAARLVPFNLPSWNEDAWYFDPFAWQFLFVLGALLSFSPVRGPRPAWPADTAAALVVVAGGLLSWLAINHPAALEWLPARVGRAIVSVDKTSLHPVRLLSIMAWAWLVSRLVPSRARWLRGRAAAPFVLCGQNSLPVFCVSIFLSFLGRILMEDDDGVPSQLAVNCGGAAVLVATGAMAAWYRERARGGGPPRITAAPTAGPTIAPTTAPETAPSAAPKTGGPVPARPMATEEAAQ